MLTFAPPCADDRVHMSEFFEHQSAAKLALVDDRWYADNGVRLMVGNKAVKVDRERKRVLGSDGEWVSYDRLVFATGSYPFVPPIKGLSAEQAYSAQPGCGHATGVVSPRAAPLPFRRA